MIHAFEGLGTLEVARLWLYLLECVAGIPVWGITINRLANSKAAYCYFGKPATCKSIIVLSALMSIALLTLIIYQGFLYFRSISRKECMPRRTEATLFFAFTVVWFVVAILATALTPWKKTSGWGIAVVVFALVNFVASLFSSFIPCYEVKQGKGMFDKTLKVGPKGRFSQTLDAI